MARVTGIGGVFLRSTRSKSIGKVVLPNISASP